jgi:hypothetical protein
VRRYGNERVPGGGWRWVNKLKESTMYEISQKDLERIEIWATEGASLEGGTRYHAMSYEDGMLDLIGILNSETTVEDIIG